MITNFAVTDQIANHRRADRLREAHHRRRAREALRQHDTARADFMPSARLRDGATRIAAAT